MIKVAERLQAKSEIDRRRLEQLSFDIRVCSPGIIKKFNSLEMTAEVQLLIKEPFMINGSIQTVQIPTLRDVPIIFIGGGNYIITTPVEEGDECLVFFGDQCIDPWWSLGAGSVPKEAREPVSNRRHDLSDGFALIGPRSLTNIVSQISSDTLQIRNLEGTYYIDLSDEGLQFVVGNNTIDIKEDSMVMNVGSNEIEITNQQTTITNGSVSVTLMTNEVEVTDGINTITMDSTGVTVTGVEVTIDCLSVTIASKDFLTHTHSGVTTGTGNTGGVA